MTDRISQTLSVTEVRNNLRSYQWQDDAIFYSLLIIYMGIGLYFGIRYFYSNAQDYFLGGRKLTIFPVAMSLTTSFFTGITLMGISTETYLYGTHHIYLLVALLAATATIHFVYLPVFSRLNITSMYEYLEKRFDKNTRALAAILFIISTISWFPVVIYVPVVAFSDFLRTYTNGDTGVLAPLLCMIATIYTALGGIRAVIWTEVVQFLAIFSAIIIICIKGTSHFDGMSSIIQRNFESERNDSNEDTYWITIIGGYFYFLHISALNQNFMQKYLSLPSNKSAKWTCWISFLGVSTIYILCTYCGLMIYAMFYNCDPLETKLAREQYELVPIFGSKILSDSHGFLGLFITGIFSASLSSWSTGLVSITTILFKDFTFFKSQQKSEKVYSLCMKISVFALGIICLCWMSNWMSSNNIILSIRLAANMGAALSGPSLGLFIMGPLLPWVNARGAFLGAIASLVTMSWFSFSITPILIPKKPFTTDGCQYRWNWGSGSHKFYPNPFYWSTGAGALITIAVGLMVSLLSGTDDPDPCLLAPFYKNICRRDSSTKRDTICVLHKQTILIQANPIPESWTEDPGASMPMAAFSVSLIEHIL